MTVVAAMLHFPASDLWDMTAWDLEFWFAAAKALIPGR